MSESTKSLSANNSRAVHLVDVRDYTITVRRGRRGGGGEESVRGLYSEVLKPKWTSSVF